MNLLKAFFKRETAIPMTALAFASVASAVLIGARVIWTHDVHYGVLVWNLFLAWLPLIFAVLARELYRDSKRSRPGFWCMAGAWLLFFPNAPYIFTDLIHLTSRFYRYFWVDLTLILLCAFTGLILGFVSLYLMQSVVTRMVGRLASWLFVAVVAGLSGFGIYLGRFLRFNSWDVIVNPAQVYHGLNSWASNPYPYMYPYAGRASFAFPVLFALFVFVSYVMLYALTHLPKLDLSRVDLETKPPVLLPA